MTTDRAAPALYAPPAGEMVDDLSIEYPETDDMPMPDNDEQFVPVTDALSALRYWYSDRDDVYVSGNLFVYYRMNDNRTWVAPDVFVVMGGTVKGFRDSWITWREGKPPDFAMEFASRSTWRYDLGDKRRIYVNMGVPEYWRFDPAGRYFRPPLVGERLVNGQYQPIPVAMDADGILRGHSAILGLDLCVLPDGQLRFYDPKSGQWLRTYEEEVALRERETALRERETAARERETAAREAAERALQDEAAAREETERSLQDEAAAREAAERALQDEAVAREAAESALQQESQARQAAESALQQESQSRQALEAEIRRLRQQLQTGE